MFQQITDTYGIPMYKEVNPSWFACVTFPFLFGVMFGDICHGSVMLAFGLGLLFGENKIRESGSSVGIEVLKLRYLFVLLGIFSTFCGLMYNDFASIPLFFNTCYTIPKNSAGHLEGVAVAEPGCVVPFGVDPAWYLSTAEITFQNSMKMKISVIFGVAHMTLGVCMKGMNAVYFSNKIDFFFEFVPQIILLLAMFGYMDLLIILKWLTDYTGREHEAPSIISTMIAMFLAGGVVPEGEAALIVDAKTQQTVSLVMVVLVVICVPTMLIPKPVLVFKAH